MRFPRIFMIIISELNFIKHYISSLIANSNFSRVCFFTLILISFSSKKKSQGSFPRTIFIKNHSLVSECFTPQQKKRGRPKGSTNKPKAPGASPTKLPPHAPGGGAGAGGVGAPRGPPPPRAPPLPQGRPRGAGYQYAVRPFRKDFSGIQFRR